MRSYRRRADTIRDQNFIFNRPLSVSEQSTDYTESSSANHWPNSQFKAGPSVFNPQGSPFEASYFNYYIPFSKYVAKAL